MTNNLFVRDWTELYPTRWPPFVTFAEPTSPSAGLIENAIVVVVLLALAAAASAIVLVTVRFIRREETMGRLKMPFVAAAAARRCALISGAISTLVAR
jgi:hypothetical protein